MPAKRGSWVSWGIATLQGGGGQGRCVVGEANEAAAPARIDSGWQSYARVCVCVHVCVVMHCAGDGKKGEGAVQ